MSVAMKKSFAKKMGNMEAAGLLREEVPVLRNTQTETQFIEGQNVINFMTNDFLSWHTHSDLTLSAQQALETYHCGSTSSRISIGTLEIHHKIERAISHYLSLEESLVFSSHYLVSSGLFDALTNKQDTIFADEMCNPSLVDGIRLSRAKVLSFDHKDYDELEYHLKCSQNSRFRLIVTDSVFNSDGEMADLERIHQLKETYDAITIVDDSLGIGVLGERGKGSYNHLNAPYKADIIIGSFAYALGNVAGGFISGDKTLVNWLRQTSRSYILSEPISAVNVAAVIKAIDLLENNQANLDKLFSNARYFKQQTASNDWNIIKNEHPFASIVIGSTLKVQKMVEYMFENGILVTGLCFPNTPEGLSRIRINFSNSHSTEQIDRLISVLSDAINRFGSD